MAVSVLSDDTVSLSSSLANPSRLCTLSGLSVALPRYRVGGAVVGEDGEEILGDDSEDFVVQRRDVNAGRAVMSGPVLYSVAESVAQPR